MCIRDTRISIPSALRTLSIGRRSGDVWRASLRGQSRLVVSLTLTRCSDTISAHHLGPTTTKSTPCRPCTGDCSRMPRPARRSRRRCIKSFAAGAACSANCSRLRHPPKLSRPALQSDTLSSPLVKLSWRLSLQACLPPSRTAIYQLSRARGRLPQHGSRRRRCAEREKNGVRC